MIMKLKGKQFINIVQAYAPTSASSEDELSIFHEQLDTVFKACKSQEIKIIVSDFNTKVGNIKNEMVGGSLVLENEMIKEKHIYNGVRKEIE